MAVTQIRHDILVLTVQNSILVGVVVVKKPGYVVLDKPTFIRELFDQMKLIQLFYGMGPALGMLINGKQFVVCWFPGDDEVFSAPPKQELCVESSPVNGKGEKRSYSPPGDTPSRKRTPSNIFTKDEERKAKNGETLLNVRCLTRMSHARSHYYVSLKRHLFRFHRGTVKKLTWVAACDSSTSILENIQFYKFPKERVKNLIAVEDLGRGSSGKVWLVTTTETLKSICVFKFDNKNQRFNLDAEAEF
eukprot:gene29986-39165_t